MPNVSRPRRKLPPKGLVILIMIYLLFGVSLGPSQESIRLLIPPTSETIYGEVVATTSLKDSQRTQAKENFIKSPLYFEANQGQADSQVRFLSHGLGFSLYLSASQTELLISKPSSSLEAMKEIPNTQLSTEKSYLEPLRATKHSLSTTEEQIRIRMSLVGGNPNARIEGHDQLSSKSNYLFGNDPQKWLINVPHYQRVQYEGVYPGIDLIYYGNQKQLEYDFVVAPYANAHAINLAFEGANSLRLNPSGELLIETPVGVIRQHKPFAYQESAGLKREVSVHYELKGDQQAGLHIAEYDLSKPLIIDPVLQYSSYLGGIETDQALAVAVDSSGNAYLAGYTLSSDFPLMNPLQNQLRPGFVTKMNATGNQLIYSTYISNCTPFGITLDQAGNAYLTGRATEGFPTTPGAFQENNRFREDAFALKLNPSGSGLIYSTFIGGDDNDIAHAIAIDSAGDAYIAGNASFGFPTTPGAFQTLGGNEDAFITKLNPTGTGLLYSTYLGASSTEQCFDLALDSSGCVYVVGATRSADFPVFNALQSSFGGFLDAFVTKLNSTGTGLVFSTYLGGSGGQFYGDMGIAIALDTSGNIYVGGRTESLDFPVTPGAFQPTKVGSYNGFITKLNNAGNTLIYSTYIGGGADNVAAIKIDQNGNAFLTGWTFTGFPITSGAFQSIPGNNLNSFLAQLNATGTELLFSTYLSGDRYDEGVDIAADMLGNVYVVGRTESMNFLTTPGAFQPALAYDPFRGVNEDGFIVKVTFSQPFDVCLQDDSSSNFLQINTTTGEYRFSDCDGLTITGRGEIINKGRSITLQHNAANRKLLAKIDSAVNRATAFIQILSQGTIFTITDRNTTNNICHCE